MVSAGRLPGKRSRNSGICRKDCWTNPVVATDATVVTVNKEQRYIRNFSAEDTVIYYAMEKKSIPALKEVSFLKSCAGTLVHDHETALYHFGTRYGECNVHLLRYLRKNTEESRNGWSKEMSGLLVRMNHERKEAIRRGMRAFPEDTVEGYKKEYTELIVRGKEENKGTKHKYAKEDEKSC